MGREWGFGIAAGIVGVAACTSFSADSGGADAGAPTAEAGAPIDAGADVDASAASITSAYARTVLADAPLAYFRLDEEAGDAVNLGSARGLSLGYGAKVQRSVPGLIAGDSDTAIRLDGSDGAGRVLSAAANAAIEPAHGITLECWIRRDGGSTADGTNDVFSYLVSYDLRDGVAPYQSYVLQLNGADPTVHFALGSGTDDIARGHSLTIGATYHLAATYDGGHIVIYVNGQSVLTAVHTGPLLYDGKIGLDVGGNSIDLTNAFDGAIDEVAIYGTALSADRIEAHYVAGTQY